MMLISLKIIYVVYKFLSIFIFYVSNFKEHLYFFNLHACFRRILEIITPTDYCITFQSELNI